MRSQKRWTVNLLFLVTAMLFLFSGCQERETTQKPENTPASAVETITDKKPELTPEVTPEATQVPAPEPLVVPTPEPVPVPTPKPTPEVTPVTTPEPVQPMVPEEETEETPDEPAAEASHAGLYRADDLTALYERGSGERIAPASLTKVVTACTALKYCAPDEVFTVGTELELVEEHSSLCLIRPGHRLTLYHLIMGMFLPSGNDAAYTVAVNVGRRVAGDDQLSDRAAADYFCGLMNAFAAELGAVDSHFASPEGWDNEDTYSTVHDLAVFAAYAMKMEEIREIAATYEKKVFFASGENITWKNFNSLVNPWSTWYCEQAVGLKTGSTENAGKCLLSAFEGEDGLYIAVVMGCQEDGDRYRATWDLIDLLDI